MGDLAVEEIIQSNGLALLPSEHPAKVSGTPMPAGNGHEVGCTFNPHIVTVTLLPVMLTVTPDFVRTRLCSGHGHGREGVDVLCPRGCIPPAGNGTV
eukprot:59108-Amphidinium_carterae.6